MYITVEHYQELTMVECYLWCYFGLNLDGSRTAGQTGPMRKSEIVERLDFTRPTLDKTLASLVEKGFIRIISKPRKPLVVQLIDKRLNDMIDEVNENENTDTF